MKKIMVFVLLLLTVSAYAQQQTEDLSSLTDADYINFANKHWGPRPEGWKATGQLQELVGEVSRETIDCSKKLKYVPKPTLAPPGVSYFVGYIISLRKKNKRISANQGYIACLNAVLNPRQSEAYLTQD